MKRLSVEFVLMICIGLVLGSYILVDRFSDRDRRGSVSVVLEPIPSIPTKNVRLFDSKIRVNLSDRDLYCLALNIYHESKFESFLGKMAVANITYNRMLDGRWGRDICRVVYAKSQFSWTLLKDKKDEVPTGKGWIDSKKAARAFDIGFRVGGLDESDHYHGDYIKKPVWAYGMEKVTKIGKHIFYATREFE